MNTTTPERIELIALVDMDGTVVDFDGKMATDLATLAAPNEEPTGPQAPAWLTARKHLIRSVPGWWENLPEHRPGMEIVEVLRDWHGFKLMVLTKGPYQNTQAWDEKVRWCRKHLPGVPVTITEDKGLMYGKVLVDDWPAYGIRWLEWRPRGLLIVPAWPWNELDQYPEHLHANIFRYHGLRDMRALDDRLTKLRVG